MFELGELARFRGPWPGPLRWWAVLCGVALVNLIAWTVAALILRRRTGHQPLSSASGSASASDFLPASLAQVRRRHLFLSGAFVLVCGFRSVFPRADVQRICLLDSWLSSVAVGRSLATIAELCFVAQWALLLRELGERTGVELTLRISRIVLPLIAVAECFSWYAVLTTRYIGNAVEESLWTVAATLTIVGAAATWPRLARRHRPWLAVGLGLGLGYVGFMCTVDVPMYVSRWLADQAAHRAYLSLGQGLIDVSFRWVVTHSWQAWRTEMPWMTLYFSVAVWMSIALMHLPRLELALGVSNAQTPARGPRAQRENARL